MRPPVAASSAARSPAPLRRREKSPVKSGEYPASASRARASGESAYPYVTPASRARPSWRTEREEEEEEDDDDDGFEEEEEEEVDAFGLAEREQLDRRSIEPEGIEPDDDPRSGIDLDKFSSYAYANTRRPERWRDALTASFPDFGPAAGREACSHFAEGKGKGKYEGMAQVAPLASISESTSMSRSITTTMPRSRRTGFSYPLRRSDSPPPEPALMDQVIEADEPWSDTYEAFYLTPLPPLSTTTYEVGDLAEVVRARGRGTNYVKKGIVIPAHTASILIAESVNTSPTTTTTTGTGTTTGTTTGSTSTTSTSTSTNTSTSTTTHTTTLIPSSPLTAGPPPDDDFDEDEGFSEPTTLEATAAMERQRERDIIACMRSGRSAGLRGMAMGMGEGVGGVGEGSRAGGVGVVRPRVRKRITKRKGGRRDGGGV